MEKLVWDCCNRRIIRIEVVNSQSEGQREKHIWSFGTMHWAFFFFFFEKFDKSSGCSSLYTFGDSGCVTNLSQEWSYNIVPSWLTLVSAFIIWMNCRLLAQWQFRRPCPGYRPDNWSTFEFDDRVNIEQHHRLHDLYHSEGAALFQ